MIKTVKNKSLLNKYNREDNLSWLTNISSCIWLSKIIKILKKTIDNKEDSNTCVEILNEEVKVISSYTIDNIERYRIILNEYCNKYLNSSLGSVE